MKRSQAVTLTLVASVAALLTGCDMRSRRYCVDANQNVSDDVNCLHGDPRYHWYYARGYGSAHNGTHIHGGSVAAPAGGYVSRSGASVAGSQAGGTVRGGIGAAGEAAAGHGGGFGHGGGGGE